MRTRGERMPTRRTRWWAWGIARRAMRARARRSSRASSDEDGNEDENDERTAQVTCCAAALA